MSPTAAPRSATRRPRLAAAAIALPLMLSAVLSGCSAGQVTQTAAKRPGVEGAQAQGGDIRVLNAYFSSPDGGVYESGDEADLEMVVASMGLADELTAVTVDGAEATINGGPAAIPADGRIYISTDSDITISVEMTSQVYPATLIPVTLSFSTAGDIEFQVPVGAPQNEVPRDPEQAYTPSEDGEGGHG